MHDVSVIGAGGRFKAPGRHGAMKVKTAVLDLQTELKPGLRRWCFHKRVRSTLKHQV